MTPKERADTSIIDAKRRKRIAMGSGTKVADVNKLLKQFEEMRKMMRKLRAGQVQAQQQQAAKKSKAKKGKLKKGKNNTKVKMPTLPSLSGLLGSLGSKFPFGK